MKIFLFWTLCAVGVFGQSPVTCKISIFTVPPTQAVVKAEYVPEYENRIRFTAITGRCIRVSFNTENNSNYLYRLVYKNNFFPRKNILVLNADWTTNSIRLDSNYTYWSMSPIYIRGDGQTNYFYDNITENRAYKVLVTTNFSNSI